MSVTQITIKLPAEFANTRATLNMCRYIKQVPHPTPQKKEINGRKEGREITYLSFAICNLQTNYDNKKAANIYQVNKKCHINIETALISQIDF